MWGGVVASGMAASVVSGALLLGATRAALNVLSITAPIPGSRPDVDGLVDAHDAEAVTQPAEQPVSPLDPGSIGVVLRLLGEDLDRLNAPEAISQRVVDCLRRFTAAPWAAVALHPGEPNAAIYGLEHPDGLERALDDGAAAADGIWRVRLVTGGAAFGTLILGLPGGDAAKSDARSLAEAVAPLLASTLRTAELARANESLAAALAERERDVARRAQELVAQQEEQRRRIALDLHDEPLQRVVLLYRDIRDTSDHPRTRRWLTQLESIVLSIRGICDGLRPSVLHDFGLVAGLEWLIEDVRARTESATHVTLTVGGASAEERLPAALELALFRVAQEALNNCVKHARATRVAVTLWSEAERVKLTVADDGRPGSDTSQGLQGRGGLGIVGMRERLAPWGGVLSVERGSDEGTTVVAEVGFGDGR
jgi:signal transduction histidine kinase